MSVVAVVPARGGSKGIHRKNLRLLNGFPLIVHAIHHAQQARLIDRVIVSTEDEEIAHVARNAGAEVPFLRPAELATDDAVDLGAFQHVLHYLKSEEGVVPELLVQVRATSPVRRPVFLDLSVRRMRDRPEVDSLRSISTSAQTPYKMWHYTEDGLIDPVVRYAEVPDWFDMPRQALPPAFIQDGLVDVVRPRTVLELKTMAGEKLLGLFHAEPAIDVDDVEALTRAGASSIWDKPVSALRGDNLFAMGGETGSEAVAVTTLPVLAEIGVDVDDVADAEIRARAAGAGELVLRCDLDTSLSDTTLRSLSALAKEANARRVMLPVRDSGDPRQVALGRRKELRRIADYMTGQGVELCLDWDLRPEVLYELLGIIGHASINVAACVESCGALSVDELDDLELLAHRIGVLYVRDADSEPETWISQMPLFLKRLSDGHFEGDIVMAAPRRRAVQIDDRAGLLTSLLATSGVSN
ncbi:cytidylyltransferase domain-containing protein [Streptomyces sp. NPDC051362]|uniref:acylneuraminate cytidylyltransferase family protein n=1 Tax=Streptomyces sp. NPDC051362 TaxID=3365651 RepID=UPI0037B57555